MRLALSFVTLFLVSGYASAQTKPTPQPRLHTSCKMTNNPVSLVSVEYPKGRDVDNWRVECAITEEKGDETKTLYKETLTLPFECSFREAAEAVDVWRNKTAVAIIKEKFLK
jgi:hypothetical protein